MKSPSVVTFNFFNRLFLCFLSLLLVSCQPSKLISDAFAKDFSSTKKINLVKQTVVSRGHPIALWGKADRNAKGIILFIHGRTWSARPDFDLQIPGEDLSLMDGMIEQGYSSFAVDLRGYGATPRDSSQWLSPNKAAIDVVNVIDWISLRHDNLPIHVFGWSYGSVISLLASQMNDKNIASLTLFGFWLDLDSNIEEDKEGKALEFQINSAEAAASDFIVPGSISKNAVDGYVRAALITDPIRVDWRNQYEFMSIDPSKIEIPVLLIQGEYDPIAPTEVQAKLFTRLKTAEKSWVVIAGGDHAAFMETPRPYFIRAFSDFIDRFNS